MPNGMTTGQRIRRWRKAARLTQAELALKIGLPHQSISQWERDIRKAKIENLQRIVDACGASFEPFGDWGWQK